MEAPGGDGFRAKAVEFKPPATTLGSKNPNLFASSFGRKPQTTKACFFCYATRALLVGWVGAVTYVGYQRSKPA